MARNSKTEMREPSAPSEDSPAELASAPPAPLAPAASDDGTEDGEITKDGPTKTWLLPSGRRATMLRQPKGRHQRDAVRSIGNDKDQVSVIYALVAQTTTIDGRAVTYEDVLEMPLQDAGDLQVKLMNLTIKKGGEVVDAKGKVVVS